MAGEVIGGMEREKDMKNVMRKEDIRAGLSIKGPGWIFSRGVCRRLQT